MVPLVSYPIDKLALNVFSVVHVHGSVPMQVNPVRFRSPHWLTAQQARDAVAVLAALPDSMSSAVMSDLNVIMNEGRLVAEKVAPGQLSGQPWMGPTHVPTTEPPQGEKSEHVIAGVSSPQPAAAEQRRKEQSMDARFISSGRARARPTQSPSRAHKCGDAWRVIRASCRRNVRPHSQRR